MLAVITNASVKLVNRYLPSSFVFSIILTIIAFAAGLILTGQDVLSMAGHWGNGLWLLHGFAMQMALILITGYALANAPFIQRFLDAMADKVHSPKAAIIIVTLVAMAGALINWGFGLVISAVFARSLAKKVTSVDYPLLVAAAYSGFLVWHSGLSGSIPLALSSGGDTLEQLSGSVLTEAIPLSQTIFAPYNLAILVTLIVVIPVLNSFMHPKNPTLVNPSMLKSKVFQAPEHDTPAKKLDDSRLVALVLLALAFMYYVNEFTNNGFSLGFNIVIGLFLFIGLLAHGTLERYYLAINSGISSITGIVLLYPFYGGIMGIMTGANLNGISISTEVTEFFINNASAESFPVFAFLSAGIVNVFVPSGGGQFAVQGPVMIPAGTALGVSPSVTAMAIAWGDAWTNMIQPFWALPLLGIAGLDARAIMGYCLIVLAVSGLIIMGRLLFLV